MSGVRRWNLFLRSVMIAALIVALGIVLFRIGVIEDASLALWPTFRILQLDGPQMLRSLVDLAFPAAVQLVIWTLLAYVVFAVADRISRGSGRRS